jgi:ketopantoate reductase
MPSLRILVVGAGAIGTCIAARMQHLGYDSILLGRNGGNNFPVSFSGWSNQYWLKTKKLDADEISRVSLAFFATKAFDLEGSIRRIVKYLPLECPIIPVSNGYTEPTLRALGKEYRDRAWRTGFCSVGVSQISDASYEIRSQRGGVVFGPLHLNSEVKFEISGVEKELLNRDHGEFFFWADPISSSQHLKWLYNTVINTVCAAYSLSNNGQTLEKIPLMREMTKEAYRLGNELWGNWGISEEKVFDDLIALVTSSASNENSMARDIRMHKRTETDWLAGVARGKSSYPLLNQYHSLISSKYRSIESRD